MFQVAVQVQTHVYEDDMVSEKIDFRTKISIVGHPLLATGRRIGHDRQSVLQTPSCISITTTYSRAALVLLSG